MPLSHKFLLSTLSRNKGQGRICISKGTIVKYIQGVNKNYSKDSFSKLFLNYQILILVFKVFVYIILFLEDLNAEVRGK